MGCDVPNGPAPDPPRGLPPIVGDYLGEVIVYAGVLSSSDITAIENYLKTKWGIA